MGRKAVDLSSMKFGRWKPISRAANAPGGYVRWLCRCDCGTERVVDKISLQFGRSKSCGCYNKEVASAQILQYRHLGTAAAAESCKVHGHRKRAEGPTPTYNSWAGMIQRCTNSNNKKWPEYGGRGISICDRWLTFENFLADMGERPDGTTIDRYPDNDGDYEPGNCRWATPKQQANNRRVARPRASAA